MKSGFWMLALAGAVLVAPGAARATSLVTNGSFELGTAPGSFADKLFGDTSITGWTVIDGRNTITPGTGSVDYIGSYWTASNGVRSLDLDGTTPGGVQQSLATIAGHEYQVVFDMAGNIDGPPAVKVLVATPDGTTVFSFDPPPGTTRTNMHWQTNGFDFTATGSSVMLKFQSLTVPSGTPGTQGHPGSFGAAIDNVIVTDLTQSANQTTGDVIPEPVTMLGLVLAAGSVVGYVRRRKLA
jgi:choice-of-anchor C domain-containing protein